MVMNDATHVPGVSSMAVRHSRLVCTQEKNEVSPPQPPNELAKMNSKQSSSSLLPGQQPAQ